jgi:hypothetical protein
MSYPQRIAIQGTRDWGHHRSGWPECVEAMRSHLHVDGGVKMFPNTAVPSLIEGNDIVTEPWVAVLHLTPTCVEKLQPSTAWEQNRRHCKGVFMLTRATTAAFRSRFPDVPAEAVTYGLQDTGIPFDPATLQQKRHTVICPGHWLRDIRWFNLLSLPPTYQKRWLCGVDHNVAVAPSVRKMAYAPSRIYDAIMARSLCFLPLIDAGANTSVLECLVRASPVVVTRHDAVAEYLGEDYPLFYNDVGVAAGYLQDPARLLAAHEYLKAKDKTHATVPHFLKGIAESDIYRSLR